MTAPNIRLECGALDAPEPGPRGVRVYKGIPYAAAPVGALRWCPPQPVAPWTGVRSVEKFGPNAMQGVVWDDIDPYTIGISEDCLYLNVWTPAAPRAADRLPVLVWIHGGGFVAGSGAEPRYDGTSLSARGIVVVTLNYRLNALGFLAHPELSRESGRGASGNYAMLDLVAALGWVQNNIEAFGGDPMAVTIAGESAGSSAVSALMASPLARGLFHRVIGESGAMFAAPTNTPSTLAAAEARGLDFMRKLGVSDLAGMRALPAEAVLNAAPGVGLGFRTIVEGYFLPRPPAEIFAAGAHNDVPLLAGWNKDEGFNFTLLQGDGVKRTFGEHVRGIFGSRASEAFSHYPSGSPAIDDASACLLGGDLRIVHATRSWIEAQKMHGRADVYRFQFDRVPLTPQGWFGDRDSNTAGAFHAGELLYVFDTIGVFPWLVEDADHELARVASSYWANFIKSGNPNGTGLPPWPSFRESAAPVMHLDTPPHIEPADDEVRHNFLVSVMS